MTRLLAALLILTLYLLPAPQARSVTCTIRTAANGRRVCHSIAHRPGSLHQSYPLFVCQIIKR